MDKFEELTLSEKINHEDVIANAKAHVRMYKQGYRISFCEVNYLHFLVAVYNEVVKEICINFKTIDLLKDTKKDRKQLADYLNRKMVELEKIEFVAPVLA